MNVKKNIEELKEVAKDLRKLTLTMIYKAQSGHPGGSLSAADIIAALYFREMNVDAKNPNLEDRDRFVLSKGHVAPILYTALMLKGYFGMEEINNLRKFRSILQGHPDMNKCPGVDISTGSLGQGISCAVGMAIAAKLDNKNYNVYTLVGDGESNEGQVWEAAQSASKYELDNFIVIIDNNGLQNDGSCDEIMPTLDLAKKFDAFGFEVINIDGHNMEEIVNAFDKLKASRDNKKPKCIVAKTIKGRGVSFMENVASWHGMAPNEKEFKIAIKELERGL